MIYGYTRYRTATSLGDPDDFVLLTNHSPSYTDAFIGEGLYFHAPMVRWALEHDGACSWSILGEMIARGTLNPQERKVFEFNRSQNVTAGYSISFKSLSPRTKGAIALTARTGGSQGCTLEPDVHSGKIATVSDFLLLVWNFLLSLPNVRYNDRYVP